MEAEFIAGDDTDWEQYLHLVGTLSRALSHLGIERKALDVTGHILEAELILLTKIVNNYG